MLISSFAEVKLSTQYGYMLSKNVTSLELVKATEDRRLRRCTIADFVVDDRKPWRRMKRKWRRRWRRWTPVGLFTPRRTITGWLDWLIVVWQ